MSLDRKITDLLPAQIPDYVQEFYPMFVIFVTKYFEWLEQDGNPQEIIQNITLNRDIDTTASSLATKFVATYAPNLPQSSALDRPTLVKNFRDFYRAKGSVKSFEFFFRAFYDDEIKVKLPGNQLFKTSDGNWYVEKTLRVLADVGNPEDLLHTTITGAESGATGIVEKAVKTYGKWDLTLQNRSLTGTFSSSETITGYLWDFENDVSSLVSVTNTGPLITAPGRQLGTNSLLSSDQIIQDSVYWQKFSYVIRTRVNLGQWKDAILEQLHPTGRNMFGELYIDNTSSITATSTFVRNTAIETQVKLFGDSSQFYVVPGVTWDRLANFKTGTSETTTAGAVTYDAAYTFGGENVTFALQSGLDGALAYQEQMSFTSVTGLVSVEMTTGSTALGRDQVTYIMPITSITGTINAVAQTGGEITFTGSGTLFSAEMPSGNIWRSFTGQRDVAQNPVYTFYSSVLTIKGLPITGTLTIAAQTPVGPDYYIYATGTGTQLQSDLLVTGSSALVSGETDRPVLDVGQDPITVTLEGVPITGNITFNKNEVTATGVGTAFGVLSENSPITIIKPLSGRLTQVSSIPATATSYVTEVTTNLISLDPISGTGLTTLLTTSNYSAITADGLYYGIDRSSRYDIPVPFSIALLGTSTNTLYVHSVGAIALASSAPFVFANSGLSIPQPHIYVFGGNYTYLNNVYYGTSGVTPNRQFKVYCDGHWLRPYYEVTRPEETTTATIRGAAALGTAITAMTSGNATNGYREFTLPWNFYWAGSTATTKVYVAHNGNMSFGTSLVTMVAGTLAGTQVGINAVTSSATFASGDYYYYNAKGNFVVVMNQSGDGKSVYDEGTASWVDFFADPKKMIKLYSATVGTAPNRVHVIRYEGNSSTAATAGQVIWEANFYESETSSLTFNYAAGPETVANMTYTDLMYWALVPTVAVDSSTGGLYVSEVLSTDNSLNSSWATDSSNTNKVTQKVTYVPALKKSYEVTFHENSSSGVTVKLDPNLNIIGQPYFGYTTSPYRFPYGQSAGPTNSFAIELAESSTVNNPSTQVSGITGSAWSVDLAFNFKPSKVAPTAEIVSSIPATSSDFVLMSLANYFDGTPEYGYKNISTSLFSAGGGAVMTSTGVVARWPQDGWNSTASNPNPNPTCSSIAALTTSYRVRQSAFGPYNWYSSVGVAFLFTGGSSTSVASRFIQTKTNYGRVHQISFPAIYKSYQLTTNTTGGSTTYTNSIGSWNTNTLWNDLAGTLALDDLELWYSTADIAPQVPSSASISPSTRGWTKAFRLAAGSSYTTVTSFVATFKTTGPAVNLTWLIWQNSFRAQTSVTARTSEYALTGITLTSDVYNSSAGSRISQSSTLNRVLSEVTSGTVLRIPSYSDRSGNTVTVDYVVARDPAEKGVIAGNQYLVLKATTSTPLTGYINEWYTSSATSYGTYFLGLQSVPAYMVEERVVDQVYSDTSFTVTTAFDSTSNRYWGGGDTTSTGSRKFNVVSVPTNNSIVLVSPTASSAPITASNSGISVVADRRFTVVSINSDTDITVSGGGIYANFTGKTSNFPKIETGPLTISGYHDQSGLTSDTTWVNVGFPGYNDGNTFLGNAFQNRTTITIGGSSFTVVSVLSDTAMLVTGSPIIANFYDTSMVSYFPAPSAESMMYGTGTKFELSSNTVSGITTTTEEVTVYDGTDRRLGFIRVDGIDYRILDIVDSSTLVVSHSVPIVDSVSGATGYAYERNREYGSLRSIARPGIGTFDSAGNNITVDESMIAQGNGVDFTKYLELYHSTTSLTLTTGQTIVSTSITVKATNNSSTVSTLSSYLLLVTWMKDLAGSAENENINELTIAVTSNAGTFTFDATNETQRNSKDIAVGRTLMYSDTVYVNSSNSITVTGDSSGTTSVAVNWIPFCRGRSGTYSRVAVRLGSILTTSAVTTATITISTSVNGYWNATSSDFLNVTVIGAE